ncbi:flavin monoamine oxidase family protein [Methylobacterium planeticum]|uniref:Tryptophan 2-monooxygenase n=1 Tax=Methylobacterium planeticum TaxID=2615211 RepID=A0A6N6MUB2_9HYPH|nr:FAD-dependent oxidoreductase [Methylobacterium planeticum]KAB1073371.1 FAD-dependent oxidoreductase [Methylobacterium planeticum]
MDFTRRSLLAGVALLAAPPLRAAQRDGPVIVVGAGAAGLAAAEVLRRAGHAFTLVEARGRIGGRAFTDASLGPDAAFDAGAQYIHWADRNPWRGIAEREKARIGADSGWARTLLIDGRPATEAERDARRAGFGTLTALLVPSGDDRSIRAAAQVGGAGAAQAAANLTRLSLGEEPERVSLADYDRLWSGEDLWVDGYGALVARHHADLPVRRETIVTGIDWSGAGVTVATSRGTLAGAAVIVTVPVGVLASGAIRFAPGLPPGTEAALAGLGMGAYTKIALRLDPARLDLKAVGDAVSVARRGERDLTLYFEMAPFGRPLAIANLGGDGARALCEAGEAAAIAEATDRLVQILGTEARGAVTGGRLAGWWTDPFARGGYSIARPGCAEARLGLRRPIADRVFLAGEALADGGAMTVGGATLDGARAAAAVLRVLAS